MAIYEYSSELLQWVSQKYDSTIASTV